MKKINAKTVGAVALGLGIVAGTVLGAVAYNPVQEIPVEVIKYQTKTVEVPVEVIKEVNVTKEVFVEVEKEVFVEVDNGDMAFVLERLEDKAIIADADEIVAELKAEDKALEMAFAYVDDNRDELFDLLEDEGIVSDEDDVKIIKVFKDFEDVTIIDSDFDDEEYEFVLRYKIEDTDDEVKKFVLVTVGVEDNEVEILSVVEE
jgi:hypothetical protein